MTVQEAVHGTETVTPNGTRIYFQSAPKRLYRVNDAEVPSVTEVLDCLNKPGLPWWGMTVGVDGVLELVKRGKVGKHGGIPIVLHEIPQSDQSAPGFPATAANVVPLLTAHKLTVNHQRDKAGARGTSVHKAFEAWAEGLTPDTSFYSEEERGYVDGLVKFLQDVQVDKRAKTLPEVMVGSVEHGFAGRYDLQTTLKECELVTNAKKGTKEPFEKGRWLIDLKTSKAVYDTHHLQLEAYEGASVECGYKPTVGRAVLRVGSDGTYEVKRSKASYQDFLAVKACWDALRRVKEAK